MHCRTNGMERLMAGACSLSFSTSLIEVIVLALTCVVLNAEEYPVRLVDGVSNSEGRVEVYFLGQWGTVNSLGWDHADATVVCRQLGFYQASSSIWPLIGAFFGVGTGPVLMSDVQCDGHEEHLTDCEFKGWGCVPSMSCGHATDAGVLCQRGLHELPVRLVGGASPTDGLVEVFFMDKWGSVCVSDWDTADTSVVCRQLGFHGKKVSYSARITASELYATKVDCYGNESRLADCEVGEWRNYNPYDHYQVMVSCQIEDEALLSVRITGGITATQGYVEVYYSGQWGTICNDWGASAAGVVCRQLGFVGSSVATNGLFDVPNGKDAFLSDVKCTGDERSLAECAFTGIGGFRPCFAYSQAGVVCQAVDEHPIRLIQGTSITSGIVEVFFNGHWGVVCKDELWGANEASVVCRQLGLFGPNISVDQSLFVDRWEKPWKNYLMEDVKCNGSESQLDQCSFVGWVVKPCRVVASVFCQTDEHYPVRLSGNKSNTRGIVEVYFNGKWGKICDSGWDRADASVVCRQLDLNGTSVSLSFDDFTAVYLYDVDCKGNEERLSDCEFPRWGYHSACLKVAGVICQAEVDDYPVRLMDGATSKEGRVEILFNGQWGSICSAGWDNPDASVVCRQLGYDGLSVAVVNNNSSVVVLGRVGRLTHLSDINCVGDEDKLADCRSAGWGRTSCKRRYASVICQADETFDIRLVSGVNSRSGRVEMYFKGQWGPVCRTKLHSAYADVVCRMLGFNGTSTAVHGALFDEGLQPQVDSYLRYIGCTGNENRLVECLPPGSSLFRMSCDLMYTVGAVCESGGDLYPVRLVHGTSDYNGRVEILFYGQWGSVGAAGWDMQDAQVVCNQLGFNGSKASVYSSLFGGGDGPVLMNDVKCTGNESRLSDCPFSGWSNHRCLDVVGVICQGSEPLIVRPDSNHTRQGLDVLTGLDVSTGLVSEVWYHIVLFAASDADGNSSSCHFTIKITDSEPPVFQDCVDLTVYAGLGEALTVMTYRSSDNTADNAGGKVAVNCTSETYNGGIATTGVHPFTCTATDSLGLSSSCHFTVTLYAGVPDAIRGCVHEPTGTNEQNLALRNCGELGNELISEDIMTVAVSKGDVHDVAECLANMTALATAGTLPLYDLASLARMLGTIAGAVYGDIKVTTAVISTVNNIIVTWKKWKHYESSAPMETISSILKSVETQVSLTLRQNGNLSIQRDFIQFEGVTLRSSQTLIMNGLTLVSATSTQSRGETLLNGATVVRVSSNSSDLVSDDTVMILIRLPAAVVKMLTTSGNGTSSKINAAFICYADDTLFQISSRANGSYSRKDSRFLVAVPIVSVIVEGFRLVNLNESVVVQFKAPVTHSNNRVVTCVSWDFNMEDGHGDWSDAGCEYQGLTNGRYTCSCNRASHMTVIVVDVVLDDSVSLVRRIGAGVSAAMFLIMFIVYVSIRKLRLSELGKIGSNLFLSLFALNAVFLTGVENAKGMMYGCPLVSVSLHYLVLTSVTWMAVDARDIYDTVAMLKMPSHRKLFTTLRCVIAWGFPMVVAAMTFVVATDQYDNGDDCFLTPGLAMYIGLLQPLSLTLIHNVITYVMVIHRLRVAKNEPRSCEITRRLVKAILIGAPTVVVWCFGFFSIHASSLMFSIIFCVANCLQVGLNFYLFLLRI